MELESAVQPSRYEDVKKEQPCQLKLPSMESVASNENIKFENCAAAEQNIQSPVLKIPESDIKKKLFQAEVEKTETRRKLLIREKELIQEVFDAKERILEAEMKLALARLEAEGRGITFNDRVLLPEEGVISRLYPDISAHSNTTLSNTRPEEIAEPIIIQPTPTEFKVESSAPPYQPSDALSQLSLLDRVTVHQLASSGLDEMYEVQAPDGSVVLRANLSLGRLDHLLMGMKRIISVEMFDDQAEKVLSFQPFGYGKMELLMCNERACVVTRWPTIVKPVLRITDNHDRLLLKVKGSDKRDTNKGFFCVESVNKVRIGCIDKINKGLSPPSPNSCIEAPSGITTIDFPRDLETRCKAAIIACNFLIVTVDQWRLRDLKLKMARYVKYATED